MDEIWIFVAVTFFTAVIISWGCTKSRNLKDKIKQKPGGPGQTTGADGQTRTTGSAPTGTASIVLTGPSSKETTKTTERKIKATTSVEQNLNKSTKKPSKIKDFLRKKKSKTQSQDNSTEEPKPPEKKKQSTFKKFIKRFSKDGSDQSKDSTDGAKTANSIDEKDPSMDNAKSPQVKTAEENVVPATPARDKEPLSDQSPKVVSPLKVQTMGNIDVLTQEQRAWRLREIEQMPSNLCEDQTQLSTSVKKENLHVKIVEERCKLYETNEEGHGGKPKNLFITPRRKGSATGPRKKKSSGKKH